MAPQLNAIDPVSIRFTLSVTLTVPIEEGDDPAAYVTSAETHRMERDLIRACRVLHGDVDAECMETEALDADGQVIVEPDPRVKGDDDGREYSDPRDARDERRS